MDFNQEWKSKFPINAVFKPPLLVSDSSSDSSKSQLGPLMFKPKTGSRIELLSSPSLVSPPVFPPLSQLSLARFVSTTSLVPPSASSKIQALFGQEQTGAASGFVHNRLQFLRCPDTSDVIVFFPTGADSDQIGFLILSMEDGKFKVKIGEDNFGPRRDFVTPLSGLWLIQFGIQGIAGRAVSGICWHIQCTQCNGLL